MRFTRDFSMTGLGWRLPSNWRAAYARAGVEGLPSLVLDFEAGIFGDAQGKKTFTQLITFSRASSRTAIGPQGEVLTYGNNAPAYDWSTGRKGLSIMKGGGAISPDIADVPLGSWWNQTEGTLIVEAAPTAAMSSYARLWQADEGVGENDRRLVYFEPTSNSLTPLSYTAGSQQFKVSTSSATYGINPNQTRRIGIAYASNDFAVSIGGGAALKDTTGSVAQNLSVLRLARGRTSGAADVVFYRITAYSRRVTDAELALLTV
jgi:hypothetical protein